MRNTIILAVFILTGTQIAYGFPSNQWKHIQTAHFTISYNEKSEKYLKDVIKIAEETANTIGTHFGVDIASDSISISIANHNDYSNGGAYWSLSMVQIDARRVELSIWRGETNWLKNLLVHELSHIYTLRLTESKFFLNLEYDTSSGNNFGFISASTEDTLTPSWFIEGIAQFGSFTSKSDRRDAYREMLLNDAFLYGRQLSLNEMRIFEGTSREYELVYNQGFDLVLYLNKTYPEKSMQHLCTLIKTTGFKRAIKYHYGKPLTDLYEEWSAYRQKKCSRRTLPVEGILLYDKKESPLTTEIASVLNGRYVIANWRHNYNRYDLMVMNNERKKIIRTIKDTGKILKTDNSDRSVWFNKLTYNRQTGVENYDVYKLTAKNRLKRITTGERCIAFDIDNGRLLYASYKKNSTVICELLSDGTLSELLTLPYNTGIYSISIIDGKKAILTIARNKTVEVGILENNKITPLWDKIDTEIKNCASVGNGKIIFSSTLDGRPQLYWCNIYEDENTWYKITNVRGGVRFPCAYTEKNKPAVSCSVYDNGNHLRYKLSQPFSKKNPVQIDSLQIPATPPLSTNKNTIQKNILTSDVGSNIVNEMPHFYARYIQNDIADINGVEKEGKNEFSLGTSFAFYNTPFNYEGGAYLFMNFPSGYEEDNLDYFSGVLWGRFHIGQFRTLLAYENSGSFKDGSIPGYGSVVFKYTYHSTYMELMYQLFKDDYLIFKLQKLWTNGYILADNQKSPAEKIFEAEWFSLDYQHMTKDSKFDPGNIGSPYFFAGAGIDALFNEFPTPVSYDDFFTYEDPVYKFRYEIEKKWMFLANRLTVKLFSDGFHYDGGITGSRISPYTYTYIGKEHLFSGYTYGNIKARTLYRGGIEMKINPFISVMDRTYYYERMHLGIKFEGGRMEHFNYGLKKDSPLSIEYAFYFAYPFWVQRQSYLFIKYATPLEKIKELQEKLEYKIYFGFAL